MTTEAYVTYTHPISGKSVTDRILDFDPKSGKITVDRSTPQSTSPLVINLRYLDQVTFSSTTK